MLLEADSRAGAADYYLQYITEWQGWQLETCCWCVRFRLEMRVHAEEIKGHRAIQGWRWSGTFILQERWESGQSKKKKNPQRLKVHLESSAHLEPLTADAALQCCSLHAKWFFFSHYLDVKKRMLLSLYFWNFKIIIYIRIVVKLWKEISENGKKKSTQITDWLELFRAEFNQ